MHQPKKSFKYLMFVETNTRQLYSLGQNFVGFVLDWGRTRLGDEWQLYFGWEIGSQVFGILPILCKLVCKASMKDHHQKQGCYDETHQICRYL